MTFIRGRSLETILLSTAQNLTPHEAAVVSRMAEGSKVIYRRSLSGGQAFLDAWSNG